MPTMTTHGVCSACKYEEVCSYVAVADGPILQCEQFEFAFPDSPVPRPEPPRAARSSQPSNHNIGICSNCAHLQTCTYVRPEGGVWRCEDYA